MSAPLIAPSILSADPMRFGDEIRDVEAAGADFHHVDVMDGHFVPNLTYGVPFISALKKISRLPLDVHIMVTNPEATALLYAQAGADVLSFHAETAFHHHRLIQAIKAEGCKAGIAVNPLTPLSLLEPLIPYIDQVNVMSVNPGFSGQAFIEGTYERLRATAALIRAAGRTGKVAVQVDGGVNAENARRLCEAGATMLVAGNFVYKAADRGAAIRALKA